MAWQRTSKSITEALIPKLPLGHHLAWFKWLLPSKLYPPFPLQPNEDTLWMPGKVQLINICLQRVTEEALGMCTSSNDQKVCLWHFDLKGGPKIQKIKQNPPGIVRATEDSKYWTLKTPSELCRNAELYNNIWSCLLNLELCSLSQAVPHMEGSWCILSVQIHEITHYDMHQTRSSKYNDMLKMLQWSHKTYFLYCFD